MSGIKIGPRLIRRKAARIGSRQTRETLTTIRKAEMQDVVERRTNRWALAAAGAVCTLAGLAALGWVFAVAYSEAEPFRSLLMQLGLAGTTLISAGAQVTALAGLAMLWRAFRRR
ncbi:MAG TPA: hypothetical protein VIO94_10000 [Phenylobacterium sp.]